MNNLNKTELQIVKVFSSVIIPEHILKSSNIKELIIEMGSANDDLENNSKKLVRLRQEKKDGNFIGNWWDDREDKVQDAQIDLNKSIGKLTQKSSQLLIVNTAISKVLSDQQKILLQQQSLLKQQTEKLEEQNCQILDAQKALAQQQRHINAANQGLMEAKGVTQEQAVKLIGCVTRVERAESKIEQANQRLISYVTENIDIAVDNWKIQLREGLEHSSQQYSELEQRLFCGIQESTNQVNLAVEDFSSKTKMFSTDQDEKFQVFIQATLEKTTTQEAARQQLLENLTLELRNFQQAIDASVEQKVKGLYESINLTNLKQQCIQQDHVKAQQAQRESFEQNLLQVSTQLGGHDEALKNTTMNFEQIKNENLKSARNSRISLTVTVCVALVSLGLQLVQYFR